MADGKVKVYVGKDNLRTFTTVGDYHSDEAKRNKVRCQGTPAPQKCLPMELRSEKSDVENAPPLGLVVNRRSSSFRSLMIDAVEGPPPVNQVPMEAHISGFGGGGSFGGSTDFAAQPPNPANKEFEVKGVKPPEVPAVKDFKPEVVKPSETAKNYPVHPAAQTVTKPPPAATTRKAATGTPSAASVSPARASGGSLNPKALQGHQAPPSTPSTDFSHHTSADSTPCSGISSKVCSCVQDNDKPLMFKPTQYLVEKVQQVSLAAPDQKVGKEEFRDLKKDPLHILVLGVGSGALSMSVLNNCRVFVPGGLKVESVEPDQSTMTVAQQLFGFKDLPGVHKIEVGSCGAALQERVKDGNAANGGKYDAVVINVFNGDDTVPSECKNSTFLGQVKTVVKDKGVVLQSIHNKELSSAISDYTNVFGYKVRKDPVDGSYHVIVAGDLDLVKSGAARQYFLGFAAMMLILIELLAS